MTDSRMADARTAPDDHKEKDVYLSGVVKTYSTRKGFGFVTSDELQQLCGDIFVYNTHLVGRIGLIPGEKVEFILFYDPVTLRPQARNVRVLEPAPGNGTAEGTETGKLTSEQVTALQQIKDDAYKKAQAKGGAGGSGVQSSPGGNSGGGNSGGGAAREVRQDIGLNQVIRQAQEDAQKKIHQDQTALMQNMEWAHYKADNLYYPAYPGPAEAKGGLPKTLIPVGSEVTIIDFPIREINGASGIVKAFDEKSCRYKVVVTRDAKKGPQEFFMAKEYLRIDTLTLPVRPTSNPGDPPQHQVNDQKLKEKQDAAREILTQAASGGSQRQMNPQTMAVLSKYQASPEDPYARVGGVPPPMVAQQFAEKMASKGMYGNQVYPMLKGKAPNAYPGKPGFFFPGKGGYDMYPGAAQGRMPEPPAQEEVKPEPKPKAETPRVKEEAPSMEEVKGVMGCVWRVRLGSRDFADAIVREGSEMSSKEIRRLLPGDMCIQSGPMIRVDPGVVRMPITPRGWVTVHARSIGGPTFLEIVPDNHADTAAIQKANAPTNVLSVKPTSVGVDKVAKTYPLTFLLRYKMPAAELDDTHALKSLKVARVQTSDKKRERRSERTDKKGEVREKKDRKEGKRETSKEGSEGGSAEDAGKDNKENGYGENWNQAAGNWKKTQWDGRWWEGQQFKGDWQTDAPAAYYDKNMYYNNGGKPSSKEKGDKKPDKYRKKDVSQEKAGETTEEDVKVEEKPVEVKEEIAVELPQVSVPVPEVEPVVTAGSGGACTQQ